MLPDGELVWTEHPAWASEWTLEEHEQKGRFMLREWRRRRWLDCGSACGRWTR